jgi:surface protein
MATADKLNKLLETKAAIKQAIINKGVEVADNEPFANYANKIAAIEGSNNNSGEEELTGSYVIARFESCEKGENFIKMATELDVSNLDISNMRNMNEMFNSYKNITSLDLSNWDVSNIGAMQGMFDSCYNVTTFGDISNWNTSNLRNARSMFGSCRSLTSLDLSNWNTDSLEDMYNMFASCGNLEVLNLSNWNLNSDMERSFYSCSSLHTIRLDTCSYDTINKVISSSEFPTNTIEGVTRKIYVNRDNIADLTAPDNWFFIDCETNEVIE